MTVYSRYVIRKRQSTMKTRSYFIHLITMKYGTNSRVRQQYSVETTVCREVLRYFTETRNLPLRYVLNVSVLMLKFYKERCMHTVTTVTEYD